MKKKPFLSAFNRILFISTITIFGCAALKEKSTWEQTQQLDNVNSYKSFYLSFPKSEYAEEAKLRMEDLAWTEAKSNNTSKAYLDYLNTCPSNGHIIEIIEFMKKGAEFRSDLALSEFKSAMGTNPVSSAANIKISPAGIRSPNLILMEGTLEWTLGAGENNWGPGARHTLSGTFKMYNYTFISHPENQLVFIMTPQGYVYQSGSGIIVTPSGIFLKLGKM